MKYQFFIENDDYSKNILFYGTIDELKNDFKNTA